MADDSATLPKATIQKLIKEALPPDMRVAGDATDMILACCTEFVQLVGSEANDVATQDHKTTVMPEHVLRALTSLGFPDFVEEVTATWNQFKEDSKASDHRRDALRKTGASKAGMSMEEQIALQQQMFAAARAASMTSADSAAAIQAQYQAQLAAMAAAGGAAPIAAGGATKAPARLVPGANGHPAGATPAPLSPHNSGFIALPPLPATAAPAGSSQGAAGSSQGAGAPVSTTPRSATQGTPAGSSPGPAAQQQPSTPAAVAGGGSITDPAAAAAAAAAAVAALAGGGGSGALASGAQGAGQAAEEPPAVQQGGASQQQSAAGSAGLEAQPAEAGGGAVPMEQG